MNQLVIANGVTLTTLNPLNCALKNDYLDNLLTTAFLTFPVVTAIIGEQKLHIRRGFVPYSYVMSEITSAPSHDLLKHTKGLAIEFTWEGWTESEALLVARTLHEQIDENVRMIVNNEEQSIFIGRDYYEASVIHKTLGDTRYIAKQRKDA